jgi:nitrogen fixation NifU-like protein
MSDLRELYQEVIVDHNRHPRNFRENPAATRRIEGYNPLCGDKLTLFLQLEDGVIKDISFVGSGCAISMASASLMTEALKGKTEAEARAVFDGFHALVTRESPGSVNDPGQMGKLAIFAGVREFPTRVKCATLAWHTLQAALDSDEQAVSTE